MSGYCSDILRRECDLELPRLYDRQSYGSFVSDAYGR